LSSCSASRRWRYSVMVRCSSSEPRPIKAGASTVPVKGGWIVQEFEVQLAPNCPGDSSR
jgi:hypothetical protein